MLASILVSFKEVDPACDSCKVGYSCRSEKRVQEHRNGRLIPSLVRPPSYRILDLDGKPEFVREPRSPTCIHGPS